jgi:hypothetical protein
MATKELLTRIQSKISTLAEWKAVESTFKPLRGEICIAEIPSNDPTATTAPTMLIKIGDGTSFFKDLTWLSARAADVQSFLKVDGEGNAWTQANFEAWIKSLVTIDDVDTSAFATVVALNEVKGTADKNKTDLAELTTKVGTLETTHGTDKAALESAIAEAKAAGDNAQDDLDAYKLSNDAAVGQALTDAKAYTDELKNGTVKTNTENIGKNATAIATLRTDIQTGDSINDFKAVEDALAGKQAVGDYATKTEAQGYANAKDEAIAEAKKAGTDAAAAVTALENGKVKENATAISELQSAVENLGGASAETYETKTDAAQKLTDAKAYTDELANGQVKTNKEAIATLNGDTTVEGSVDKKINDAINAFATEVTDNGTIEKFAELVDYVGKHGGEASEMATAIEELETKVGEKSVKTQIEEAITAENLAQYATDDDLAGLAGTVSDMDTAYKAADKTLQDNIDGAVARVATLESEMDSAEGRLDTLEAHVKDVETNAEKNIIEVVKVNGTALEVSATDRSVNVAVPTGALASKDKVSKTDLGDALAAELDAKATEADLTLAEGRIAQNETDIDALQADTHTHGNKALLDTYTQTEANLADAVAKKHSHANADVINGITADNVTTWNTVTSKAAASDLTAATNRVTALEDRIGFDGDVLILNCGTSTVNV